MTTFDFFNGYPVLNFIVTKGEDVSKAKCIIDTGSPYTIIPSQMLKDLKLNSDDIITEVHLHGVIRKEECEAMAPAYMLDIQIEDRVFEDILIVDYVFSPDFGLAGHNILSNFKLVVNWKTKQIELL